MSGNHAVYTAGNVGIGTTTPDSPLTVHTTPQGSGFVHTDGTTRLVTRVNDAGILGTNTDHELRLITNNQTRARITTEGDLVMADNGRIGVGTVNPSTPIHIRTNDNALGFLHQNSNSTTQLASKIGSGAGRLGTLTEDDLVLTTNGEDRVFLTSEGSLGLNVLNPASDLHVVGSNSSGTDDYVAQLYATGPEADGLKIRVEQVGLSSANEFIGFYNGNNVNVGGIRGFNAATDTAAALAELQDIVVDLAFELQSQSSYGLLDPTQIVNFSPQFSTNTTIDIPPLNLGQVAGWSIPKVGNPGTYTTGVGEFLINLFTTYTIGNLPFTVPEMGVNFNGQSLGSIDPPPFNAPIPLPTAGTSLDLIGLLTPTYLQPGGAFGDLVCWAVDNGVENLITTNPIEFALLVTAYTSQIACLDGNVTYESSGADYAEWLPKLDASEGFLTGQVVGVFDGHISKRTEGADQIMSISLAPVVVGNTPPEGAEDAFEMVGFMGQVPVLVRGGCEAGDFLIPSGEGDGFAVAVQPADLRVEHTRQVLGRAFEASTDDRVALVNTLVGVKTNEWAELFEQQDARLDALERENEILAQENAELFDRLAALESAVEQLAAQQN